MDVSMSEIIRETRNAINSRLDMLEVLINSNRSSYSYSAPMSNISPCDNHRIEDINKKIVTLLDKYDMLESTMYKFNDLLTNTQKKIDSMEKQNVPIVKVMGDTPKKYTSCDKCYEQIDDCICDMPPLVSRDEIIPEIVIEDDTKNESEEEYCDECDATPCDGAHAKSGDAALADMKLRGLEVVDNKIVKIKKEEDEEDEEEVVEEKEEEVEEEYTSFEYKGMTLYHDTNMIVYQIDEEGALSDPIGKYDVEKQKIRKL